MKKKLGEYLAGLQGKQPSSQDEENIPTDEQPSTTTPTSALPNYEVTVTEPGTSFIGELDETEGTPPLLSTQDTLRSLVEYVRTHQPEPDSKDHPSPRNRFTREGYALAMYRLEEWIRSH